MKSYLKFLILTLVSAVMIFEVIVLGILKYPADVFHSSWQSLIQDKYRLLKETNDPKIIVVSGSSSAFGLDQKMLEDASGYKVVNLGLHAGFGHMFYSELAKENINAGDIVLLGYEYNWPTEMDNLDPALIMSGIDNDIEMYTHIPVKKWPDFIGYIFKYAETKNEYTEATGLYSREAFDSETTQLTMERDYSIEYDVQRDGTVQDITDVVIDEKVIKYLKKYKEYMEKKGASVYFIAPPILADGIPYDYGEFDKLKYQEETRIGIPYISNPLDYIFPCELMSNSVYHCNSQGEKVRTELLIGDLRRAAVIE